MQIHVQFIKQKKINVDPKKKIFEFLHQKSSFRSKIEVTKRFSKV